MAISTIKRKSTAKKEVIIDNNIYYCSMQLSDKCKEKKGILLEKDFYMSNDKILYQNGRVHICKDCFKQYVYLDGEFNLDRFKKMLMLINYPFYSSEFESAFGGKNETVGTYIKNIILNYKGRTWESSNFGYDKEVYKDEIVKSELLEVTAEMIKFWGKNYNKDEHLFLEEYYNDLTKIYDHSLPVQINNYRNMAKTQLQANKCLENGDMGGYDKSMKILSMIAGDGNIKPVQETNSGSVGKGGFDVFIKNIEDNEPVLDWEKDLGNENKLKQLLSIFFFGNLAKSLNINNPFKKEFETEMKAYTVEEAEVEEEKNQVDFLDGV